MKVAIVIPTLADGDAVGNDALGMAKHIRGRGLDVEFFVTRSHIAEPTRLMREFNRLVRSPDDVVIYHHSIGFEVGVKIIESAPCRRKAVKYHNVTPPKFFEGLDNDVVRELFKAQVAVWFEKVRAGTWNTVHSRRDIGEISRRSVGPCSCKA